MSVFTRALELRSDRYQITSAANPAYWIERLFGGGYTSSTGIVINAESAMKFSAVYAACKIISEDVGSIPVHIYRKDATGGRARDETVPANRILNREPNPEMGAFTFRETLTGHMVLRGNGFAEREYDRLGNLSAMWPLRPDKMRIARNGHGGVSINGYPEDRLVYLYTLPDGRIKPFDPSLIFNLRGFGPDGLNGYSIVRLATEGIALALAAEQYAATFYGNNATPEAYISHPKTMSDSAVAKFTAGWKEAHEGLDKSHRLAILEEGMDIKTIGVKPEEAMLVASRQFQIRELARVTRLPPHMLADLGDATYSNVEHMGIEYVKFTVRPTSRRWDQQIDLDLLRERDQKPDPALFAEHVMEELQRGDLKSRTEGYHNLRQDGAITANQIADRENFPRSKDPVADQLLIPLNMQPASAYDERGMTMSDRVRAAAELVRVGFKPDEVLPAFNLPNIGHTGLVPTVVQLLTDATGGTK